MKYVKEGKTYDNNCQHLYVPTTYWLWHYTCTHSTNAR